MNRFLFSLTGLLLILQSGVSLAADTKHGEELYKAKCGGCHDTSVHTRKNRIIHTYDDLVNRVKFCDNAAKAKFTDNDITDVVEYLNNTFYKFVKE